MGYGEKRGILPMLCRIILFACVLTFAACQPKPLPEFTTEAWLAAKCKSPSSSSSLSVSSTEPNRLDMVKQLEAGILKTGMTREEVTTLLGPSEMSTGNDKRFVYCLGIVVIDYEQYWITFDDNGRVESFRQVQG